MTTNQLPPCPFCVESARIELRQAEKAIQAMWPVFALAMAYGEHRHASTLNELIRQAEAARMGGLPKGVLETILDAAEKAPQPEGKPDETQPD